MAGDLAAVMNALGHRRFAVAGHDTGMWIGYAGAVRDYVEALAADPEALRGSFAAYRALDATITQNQQRKTRPLTLPVLAIGGAQGIGQGAANTMKLIADNVQSTVIPGCGHYCLEEAPQQILATLTAFLAPYRQSS